MTVPASHIRPLRASISNCDAAMRQLQDVIVQRERAEAALVQAQKLGAIGQLTSGIDGGYAFLAELDLSSFDLVLLNLRCPG